MASIRRVDVQVSEPEHPGIATSTGRPWGRVAGGLCLVAAAVVLIPGIIVESNFFYRHSLWPVMLAVGSLATTLALIGVVRGVFALVRDRRRREGAPAPSTPTTVAVLVLNLAMAYLGAIAAQAWPVTGLDGRRGRQLRRRGKVLLPPVAAGDAWTRPELAPDVETSVRHALAVQWRENGRTEHASVAAFARLTLDLMALGAPPTLVASANRDALDEIRHAELCFALARALDGSCEGPGPFPDIALAGTLPQSRRHALTVVAIDSLVDGALLEGLSARIAARLARCCEDPAIRAVLREIAADEGRHAAHGWDVVEWCLAEGGEPIAQALRGALATLPRRMRSGLPEAARDGAWERHGIHGQELEAQEFAKTRAHVTSRVQDLVAGRQRAAA